MFSLSYARRRKEVVKKKRALPLKDADEALCHFLGRSRQSGVAAPFLLTTTSAPEPPLEISIPASLPSKTDCSSRRSTDTTLDVLVDDLAWLEEKVVEAAVERGLDEGLDVSDSDRFEKALAVLEDAQRQGDLDAGLEEDTPFLEKEKSFSPPREKVKSPSRGVAEKALSQDLKAEKALSQDLTAQTKLVQTQLDLLERRMSEKTSFRIRDEEDFVEIDLDEGSDLRKQFLSVRDLKKAQPPKFYRLDEVERSDTMQQTNYAVLLEASRRARGKASKKKTRPPLTISAEQRAGDDIQKAWALYDQIEDLVVAPPPTVAKKKKNKPKAMKRRPPPWNDPKGAALW